MQLFNQPCAEISKLKAAKAAAVKMFCVRSEGGECEFTRIAKRKKKSTQQLLFSSGGIICLSAMTRANSDREAQVITAALPLAHQPFFPREGQRFSSPGHTQIIYNSVALKCKNNAVKGGRGIPREQKYCPNY